MPMRCAMLSLVLTAAACQAATQTPAPPTPDWMAGYWLACDGAEVAENWIGAGTGVLLGANRSGDGGFEFLRIAANGRGGYGYFSMPNGRSPPTEFTMVRHEGQRVVFENLEHDFPQRIIYERNGGVLHARIEDAAGAHGADWTFRRAEPDARC